MAATDPDLRIDALAPHHDRAGFSCGIDDLDRYLATQAGQDVRRKANGVFVVTASARPETVLGYYTLCATALEPGAVPAAVRKHIPRYPLVSATLLGRLAVSTTRQGTGLGAILLADALRRAYTSAATIGSCMVVVDALNARAAAFYAAHGFMQLPDSMRLVLPMVVVGKMVGPPTEKR